MSQVIFSWGIVECPVASCGVRMPLPGSGETRHVVGNRVAEVWGQRQEEIGKGAEMGESREVGRGYGR